MRILHVARSARMFLQFLLPVLREQRRRGDYVAVAGAGEPDLEKLRSEGFGVFDHRVARSVTPANLASGALRIHRIVIDNKFEAVVTHTPIGSAIGRLGAALAGARVVVYFCHGLPCAPNQNKLTWLLRLGFERLMGCLTDAIIVMNDYDEKLARERRLTKRGGKVLRIASMGVDLSRFLPYDNRPERVSLLRELGLEDMEKVVVSVAWVTPEKGVYDYFRAACRLIHVRPRTLFLLVGDGPALEGLAGEVRRAGIGSNFRLLGWRSDVHRIVRASDLFVLPSYYPEGLPVAIIEAMACGKPVITSTQRGCQDAVIDGETGLLVPVKDVEKLAECIQQLLDDAELTGAMGRAGRQRVERHYELHRCTQQILDALEEAFAHVRTSGG
ncbi:MAG: glycosyltransferase family 4 protein [Phycisphaerae bacterium]